MTFKQNFCSSPWFHVRLLSNGGLDYCRWQNQGPSSHWLQKQTVQQFFQTDMDAVRDEFLAGNLPSKCSSCQHMEQHGKISGRQKQLLKTGIHVDKFEKTLLSSPWLPVFKHNIKQMPQDWQIDIGNYCNSGCVMCHPASSSRLAVEHYKLQLIDQMPPANWSDDPELVKKLTNDLIACPDLRYIHFIGGETLIIPAFAEILQRLIEADKHHAVTIGFTTNLTVWSQPILDLLSKFNHVNLGLSVETITPVNDYIRWPSTLPTVVTNMQKWIAHAVPNKWFVTLRTTPTVLSIHELLSVYDFAWDNNLSVESCNFLQNPTYMRPSVLPAAFRQQIIEQMELWLASHSSDSEKILNVKHPSFIKSQICQDLGSYVNYLKNQDDESFRLPELVTYLQKIESLRGNRILDYIPNYENFFRAAGYTV